MSIEKWRKWAEEKSKLDEQTEEIHQKFKMDKINKKFGQLSGEEFFRPITKRLDDEKSSTTVEEEEQEVPDYTKSYTQNPYFFDTFDLDGDKSAKLTRCRLNYGENFYPVVPLSDKNKLRIYEHLLNYNSGVQLQIANFESLYPIIHFDLRNNEKFMTNDPLNLTLEYELNETANLQYIIYAYVINEEEFVLETLGNELVVV